MPSNEHAKAALAALTDKTKILGVKMGTHTVEPGLYIPRAEAQEPPKLSFDGADKNGKYMVVALDMDAPFPSFDVLGPILHWIQPGLTAGTDGALATPDPFVANYIGPAPPPGSAPHRYCFFLYEQPSAFDGSAHAPANGAKLGNWPRMFYSLDAFEQKVNLGPILAANYFTSN